MRDDLETDYAVDEETGAPGWRVTAARRVSVWAGALVALAVAGGLGLWAYSLTQREASAVPVIRAALSPAKVQPEDRGGAEIAYQDIAAYRAGSGAEEPGDIVFAPPPERPSSEDVALAELTGEGGASAAGTDGEDTGGGPARGADGAAPPVTPVVRPRPSDLRQSMEAARQAVSEQARLVERAAASAVQIQLGAFPEREQTETMWERIYRANEDILGGRALVIQSTISGGRRFFRLRAGPFEDQIEAQNVCRALQARGQDCLVAVNG